MELFFSGRPTPGLDLFVGYTYTNAEFTQFDDFPGDFGGTPRDISGKRLPFAPEHTVTAAAQYIRPLTDFMQFFSRVGLEGERWGVYLWGQNLTDSEYLISALDNGINGVRAVAGDPRTYGIEVQLRF